MAHTHRYCTIVIDANQVATDSDDLTPTSTRAVIIEAAAADPPPPASN
jgi:hypothetical protein